MRKLQDYVSDTPCRLPGKSIMTILVNSDRKKNFYAIGCNQHCSVLPLVYDFESPTNIRMSLDLQEHFYKSHIREPLTDSVVF